MKSSKIFLVCSVTLITSLIGCSSMVESTRKSLLGSESPRKSSNKDVKWVSKTQYDELMSKYKDISKKYENLKDSQVKARAGFDQLDSVVDSTTETVDLFDKEKPLPVKAKERPIENDVDYYFKALTLFENNKKDEALKLFQFLEKSKVSQIRIRAKNYIGQIYFEKKQYDLALQVFEGIIQQGSYSSVVLSALQSAMLCGQALGLVEKSQKYESLLKDIFEVRA